MFASVALPPGEMYAEPEVTISAEDGGDLVGESRLIGGIVLAVDLAAPDRWQRVSVHRWDDVAAPVLLSAVIGHDAVGRLSRLRRSVSTSGQPRIREEISLDLSAAQPWLRLATIDALDRWLQLPLDQSLVDAERGVVRGHAAQLLPDGAMRRGLIGEALALARSSAGGMVDYLGRARQVTPTLPTGLQAAISRVVDGYESLLREVDGSDELLTSVIDGWRHPLLQQATFATGQRNGGSHAATRRGRLGGAVTSMLDPRQLKARVVELGEDPSLPEVTAVNTHVDDDEAVLVEVPAFATVQRSAPEADHLLVRLVDRKSGAEHGSAMLALAPDAPEGAPRDVRHRFFRGVVSLRGAGLDDVRVDVFDADSEVSPAPVDDDTKLQSVRRATMFLREWRRVVAEAVLPSAVVFPARRLTALARLLTPGLAGPDKPAFGGGPSPSDLLKLARMDEAGLLAAFRGPLDGVGGGRAGAWLAAGRDVGAPLVAELAAAHLDD
jgi:hypothetical protein